MPNNNEFDFNLKLDINGQQNLILYMKAFDSLKTSINNLSRPINNLNNELDKLTDTLNKSNEKNVSVEGTIKKVKDGYTAATEVISFFRKAMGIAEASATALRTALTAGLGIIIAFAPEIINYVKGWIKGKEALDEARLSLNSLNKGISSTDYSTAIENITRLKIKVGLAKQGFADKNEIVKDYNESVGDTIGKVRTLDEVETSLKNNAGDYINMMLNKASAMAAIKEAAEQQVLAAKERNKSDEESVSWETSGWGKDTKLYRDSAKRNREKAAKPFEDAAAMLNHIASHYMVEAEKFSKKIEEKSPINAIKKRIAALQNEANAKVINSKTFKEIKSLKKELAELEKLNNPEQAQPSHKRKQKPEIKDHPDKTRHLEAASISFAETIEERQKNYDKELADLKNQQSKKLITQEEYFKQWAALQNKHHIGIIESSKLFMEKKLDETLKLQQKIAEQNQKDLIAKDEKKINKALLPAEKLNAEIELIEDKYAYELILAAGNADKINQIEQQRQNALTEINKKHEQDRKNFQLETAQQVSDAAFSILKSNLSSQSSARLKQLQSQKESELSNISLTATQRKVIEEKYKKKEAEEKVKAFKAEQRASILQAVINGALAITKVTAQAGLLGAFVIPGIIASTAIQVATIAAQKTPQYAKGGLHYKSDGKGALLSGYSRTDDTNAYLRSGEAVVVSEAMRNPWARNLVSAINVAHGGRDFSVANTGSGYAIGGIFTDGGNSNRYYSQPANDVKDLANTLAYQMINNFPPVYVDVKDINTQQSILAKTVDRVNL